jgi:hypothetical protein
MHIFGHEDARAALRNITDNFLRKKVFNDMSIDSRPLQGSSQTDGRPFVRHSNQYRKNDQMVLQGTGRQDFSAWQKNGVQTRHCHAPCHK